MMFFKNGPHFKLATRGTKMTFHGETNSRFKNEFFFVILKKLDLASILTVFCPPIHCPELDGAGNRILLAFSPIGGPLLQ
jgi:hypothetical protein